MLFRSVEVEAVDGRAWRIVRAVDPEILDFSRERARHGEVVGRGPLVERLVGWISGDRVWTDLAGLRLRAENPGGKWLLVTGRSGAGKSAVLEELLRRLHVPALFHAFEPTRPETLDPARAERSLLAQLRSVRPHLDLRGLDLRSALGAVARAGAKVVLALDGVEHLVREDAAAFGRWTLAALPEGVTAIVCADTSPEAWPELVGDEGAPALKLEEWGVPAGRLGLDVHDDHPEFPSLVAAWLRAGGFRAEIPLESGPGDEALQIGRAHV